MPTVAEPEVRKNPLHRQLAAVRAPLRTITLVRGVSFAVAVFLLVVVSTCAADAFVHLPAAIRAVMLGFALSAAGTLAYVLILRPLSQPSDDLSLALRIEEHYPALNDALASAVQFLEHKRHAGVESSSMRLEATRRTFALIKHCDFGRIIRSEERRVGKEWRSRWS